MAIKDFYTDTDHIPDELSKLARLGEKADIEAIFKILMSSERTFVNMEQLIYIVRYITALEAFLCSQYPGKDDSQGYGEWTVGLPNLGITEIRNGQ